MRLAARAPRTFRAGRAAARTAARWSVRAGASACPGPAGGRAASRRPPRGSSRSPTGRGRSSCTAGCKTAATRFEERTAKARRSAGKAPALQIAKRELEGHLSLGGALRARLFAVHREEADIEDVLVGADLRDAGERRVEPQAQHLRALAAEHLLAHALRRADRLRPAGVAQDAQDDGRAVAQRMKRARPGGELAGAFLGRPVQPVMV